MLTRRKGRGKGLRVAWGTCGLVGVAVAGGCGSASTFRMDCYEFMHSTTAINKISNSARNQSNWERCHSAGQENTVLTWDKGDDFGY